MSVYVFLDTQVLMQKQFSMHDKLICDLIAKINSDKVKLVVSPIVIQELKKHVKQCVNKAYAALKKNFVLFAIPEFHTIREQDNPEEYLSDRIIGMMQEKLFFNATNIPRGHKHIAKYILHMDGLRGVQFYRGHINERVSAILFLHSRGGVCNYSVI